MNDYSDPANETFEQDELERLADGELTGAAYRELLTRLDEAFARGNGEPWRRCALALLEAQVLRRELGDLAREANCRQTANIALKTTLPQKRGVRWAGMTMACVASFAAAFVLALVLKNTWIARSGAPAEVDRVQETPFFRGAPGIAQTPNHVDTAERVASFPWEAAGNLTLAVNSGEDGSEQRVEIPLYYVADGDVPDSWTNSSAAPAALLEALENAGHRVTHRQQFWPLTLDDGRNVIVPVEQLVVVPASSASYQ